MTMQNWEWNMFLCGLEEVLYTGEPCLICDPFVWPNFPLLVHLRPLYPGFALAHQPSQYTNLFFFKLPPFPLRVFVPSFCTCIDTVSHIARAKKRLLPVFCLQRFTVAIVTIWTIFDLFDRALPGRRGRVLPVLREERCQSVFPRFPAKATAETRFQLSGRWKTGGHQQVCLNKHTTYKTVLEAVSNSIILCSLSWITHRHH